MLEIKNNNSLPKEEKKTIKIQGTLTSPIQLRGENTQEPYHYSFIRCQGHKIDLPVIFKTKIPDNLTKGLTLELSGNYANSQQNICKSFTCSSYQILDKKIKKECWGCGDNFATAQHLDYDYCLNCSVNGNRYIPGRFTKNNCPECGEGSGIIKFPQQPPRNCKTCSLINPASSPHA